MQYFGIDLSAMSAGEQYMALASEGSAAGRRQESERRRRRDAETGKAVGCFMALIVGVTFFILSYL